MGISHHAQTLRNHLQHGCERVSLLQCCHLGIFAFFTVGLSHLVVVLLQVKLGLVCSGLGGSGCVFLLSADRVGGCLLGGSVFLAAVDGSQTLVELVEQRGNVLTVVGLPELKVGASLKELAHTLRLADTRHFYHEASLLAFELLDVGLNDAELIDTVADNVERVVDSCLHFGAQGGFHLLVGALCVHLSLQLLRSEDGSQGAVGSVAVEGVDEQRDEITLTGFFFLLCFLHGLHKVGISLVVGKHLDDIRHADLEDYIHTALEVQTQTYLRFQALLIRVTVVDTERQLEVSH